jgi:DNA-binding CsgD family transcriptional regulator
MSYQKMVEKIVELYEEGKTLQQIANYCEVSLTSIYNRLKRSGVTMRRSSFPRTPKTRQALRDKMNQLRAQGLTYKKIAESVGVSHRTVRRYLKANPELLE